MRFSFWWRRKSYKNEAHEAATLLLSAVIERNTWIPWDFMTTDVINLIKLKEINAEPWFSKTLRIYFDWQDLGILNLNWTI